MLLEKNNK